MSIFIQTTRKKGNVNLAVKLYNQTLDMDTEFPLPMPVGAIEIDPDFNPPISNSVG
ncbi:uncharacterized protein METZ01_LOCUS295388, partial [marine metagenome]